MKQEITPWLTPWTQQVRGSWWKAILIFVTYWIIRLLGESMAVIIGMAQSEVPAGADPVELTYQALGQAPWLYVGSDALAMVVLIGLSAWAGFRFFSQQPQIGRTLLRALKYFIALFVGNFVVQVGITLINPAYSEPSNQTAVATMSDLMPVTAMFIFTVILAPIAEEYLVRGLIMKYMFPNWPVVGAIVSALIFTYLHSPSNIYDFVVYFTLAMGLVLIYWRTRRLEYPIIVHMFQNFIAFIALILV